MWDLFGQAVAWLLLLFFGGQAVIFIGLIAWTIWTDAIRPRLIPNSEIQRVADEIISSHPDPEDEAFARHERLVSQRRRRADLLVPRPQGRQAENRKRVASGVGADLDHEEWCRLGDSNT